MRCPFCASDHDKVIDSRSSDQGRTIRRRRQCLKCSKRFTTYERVEDTVRLNVIKKDNVRVPYDRQKLMQGLQHACYKRPVSAEQLQHLVDEVEESLFRHHEKEVYSIEIGRIASEKLRSVDHIAYVRFASVYKDFRDLDDMLDEIKEVIQRKPDMPPDQGELFS